VKLGGIDIVVNQLLDGMRCPVLRIRDSVPCDDATRASVNAYLLETFGEEEIAIMMGGSAYISPKQMVMLRSRLS
jgi:hypothetical protein